VIRRHPDVIFTESNNLVLDLKAESATIPIVGIMGDPVGSGIVASLARPGGNITGVTMDAGPEVFAKPLELLREMNSRTSRVGVLAYRNSMEGNGLCARLPGSRGFLLSNHRSTLRSRKQNIVARLRRWPCERSPGKLD
jgi:hypothetical protein